MKLEIELTYKKQNNNKSSLVFCDKDFNLFGLNKYYTSQEITYIRKYVLLTKNKKDILILLQRMDTV